MTRSLAPGLAAPGVRRAPFVPVPPPRMGPAVSCGGKGKIYFVPPSLRPLLGKSCGNHLIT